MPPWDGIMSQHEIERYGGSGFGRNGACAAS